MKKKMRIMIKLLLIVLCTFCLIWLIKKDRTVFQLKQPKGEGIRMQEVVILLQALDESLQEYLEKYSEQSEVSFTYDDYTDLLALLCQKEYITEEEKKELLYKDKYKKGFFLLKKDWYKAYDAVLEYSGKKERIQVVELSVLSGNDNMVGETLGDKHLLSQSGKIYEYRSEEFEDCFFSSVTAYAADDVLLTIREKNKDEFTLNNVWIMEADDEGMQFFYQGFEIYYSWQSKEEGRDAVREMIGDITFKEGTLKRIKKKDERLNGKLLRFDAAEIELDGKGIYQIAENCRVYQLYEELRETDMKDLRIGYDFADFVLDKGEICAVLIMRKENMESIRVAVKNNGFDSLYHEEIKMAADSDMEITYGSYKERKTKIIPQGEELDITVGSDYLKGDRIEISPTVRSGKIQVLSLNRNQGAPMYRGKMEIAETGEGLILINEVLLEEYLYSVVPSEMPASYPEEALKAQAICARTYAYRYLISPGLGNLGANVDDSVSYQVYNNIAENVNSTKAVKETAGRLLFYEDEAVSTYYYSTSCGFGTDAGVWQESNKDSMPYLFSVHISDGEEKPEEMSREESFRDYITGSNRKDYESEEPWYRWSYQVKDADVEKLSKRLKERYAADSSKILTLSGDKDDLKEEGAYEEKEPEKFREIKDIYVLKRREGGVVDELVIETEEKIYKVISEYNVRYILNNGGVIWRQDKTEVECGSLLPSAYLVIDTVKSKENVVGYTILGGGYGHGVGMSQNAAKAMGSKGMDCEKIITFFYPECRIEKIY